MKSCMGHILEVNLSNGTIVKEKVPDEVYTHVLSGKGLGVWYLLKNIPADADPMGPENILGFVSGALTGTGAPMCGRWMVVTKSPLTGGWGDANCGGNFSNAIKRCGVDAIFFKGISEKPVFFYMDEKTCELRDASYYWGMDAVEAEEKLIEDNKKQKKPSAAVIGTAGEKLSLISGICNDGGRIAARSGVGAVMGVKKLKALVLNGSHTVGCVDKDTLKEATKELGTRIKKAAPPNMMKGAIFGYLGMVLGKLSTSMPMDGSSNAGPLSKWGTS
ncbi:MAG: aldehyde ferredoxin oxidoreductase N-terminal domain-containing protein, partial [Oscillospiraceae bacterium]